VWESTNNGRQLRFHLSGINNQNFLMQDEETGSWWQQISGAAIQGPLKGQKLKQSHHDEIAFATWKRENPNGRVLRPDPAAVAKGVYDANWEQEVAAMPVTTNAPLDQRLPPREIVVGVKVNDAAKAYPLRALQQQSPILDTLGGRPVVLIADTDGQSVRAFERELDGKTLELYAKAGASPLRLADAATGSEWDFSGKAVSGPLAGRELKKLYLIKDYWFDWHTYNRNTMLYALGGR
jgi:hypothetical protein